MTLLLLRPLLRRACALLFALAFLPVASLAQTCEAACLLALQGGHEGAAHLVAHAEEDHRPAEASASRDRGTLHQAPGFGCHLTAIPATTENVPNLITIAEAMQWAAAPPNRFRSCVWPPPEHRPRS